MFYYALYAAVPFIAALQRFCVAYGYQGVDRFVAWTEAKTTFVTLAVMMAIVALIHWGVT